MVKEAGYYTRPHNVILKTRTGQVPYNTSKKHEMWKGKAERKM